jgi:lipopolysaccharide transport system ATP-binding protein
MQKFEFDNREESQSQISVCNISKRYRLGQLMGGKSLRESLMSLGGSGKADAEYLWALQDVNFEISPGEAVGIIGRNGAGKSTLLKVLSRITKPTTGTIRVAGRVAALLEVGTGFHEELSGRENIYLNGSILGMTRAEVDGKFDDIVDFAETRKFLDTPIKRYSSGMRLRLGFAVAAHLEPDVLLVDEVLAVGDTSFQKKCLGALDDLRNGNRTVIFVSHNMAAVENLCTRAIWIDDGCVRQDGQPKDVIQSYLASFGTASGASVDLQLITGREGAGAARFTRIEYLDDNDQPLEVIRTGGPIRARLHFTVHERIAEPHFGVEIYSNMGTLISVCSTWATGYETGPLDSGTYSIELTMDNVPLLPGRYNIGLWLSSMGKQHDKLHNCSFIDVESSEVFYAGRGSDSSLFGLVAIPGRWEVTSGSG